MKKKIFWLIIFISFLFQVFLSFFETYGDVGLFFIPWARSIEKLGTTGFYERIFYQGTTANYPPLIIYILTIFHQLGSALVKPILNFFWYLNTSFSFFPSGIITFLNQDKLLIHSFVKLPNIIANIFLGVGAYCLIKLLLPKKNKSNLPILALISILFNPALIFVSALWGQVDVIPLAFIVWSFYFLSKSSYRFSVFLMSLALLSKQTVVLAVPFYLLFFVNKLSVKKIVESLMIGYLTFIAVYFPFQKTIFEKFFPFISYIKTATMFASNKVSMHAYNFWQMIMPGANDNNVRSVAQIFVGAFLFFVIYKTWKKRENITQVIAGSAVFSLFSFMFLTRMHERHLAIVLPLFLIASVLDFKFYWIFIFETIYFLINMYAAWPILGIDFLRITLNSPAIVNALVIFQLGVLILTVILWTKTSKQKN